MIEILVAKFLLKGAIKTLILKPAVTATMTIIPHAQVIHATLLGTDIGMTTKDLMKFGLEQIFDKFAGEKLEFQVEKLTSKLFRIIPFNPLAKLFFKKYTNTNELMVDLDIMGMYIDQKIKASEDEIAKVEKQLDNDATIIQMIYDLDLSIKRSKKSLLDSTRAEEMLIDEIIKKNEGLIRKTSRKRKKSVADKVLCDFPEVPYQPSNDSREIDKILSRIEKEIKGKKKGRGKDILV